MSSAISPPVGANAAERFRHAAELRDLPAMAEQLAPEAFLRSPASDSPVQGQDQVASALATLADVLDDLAYTRPVLSGADGHSHVLTFRCRVGGELVEGVHLLDLDAHDRIAGFTMLLRPLAGLEAVLAAWQARQATAPLDSDG